MATTIPAASPLDYQSTTDKRSRPNWLLRIVVAAVLLIGAASVLLPSMCKAGETANRAKCASNLHQIGLAISLYARENGGIYPDSFATMMIAEGLTPAVFVCPSSNDEAAGGDSPAQMAGNLTGKPHHLSYVYLGKTLTSATVRDDTVVAYEHPENHQDGGMNILFGDGHAEWYPMANAKLLIAKSTAATQQAAPHQ